MTTTAVLSVARPHPGVVVRLGTLGARETLLAELYREADAQGFEMTGPEWFEIRGNELTGEELVARVRARPRG
jgi:hypothetical protein